MSLIDLRSDTVTRPTPAMRRAMAEAEVGDDVLDGDPTVRRLEARVAELLGKEAGLFFPSGTMANQAGIAVLSTPGTEALLDANAHIIHWEMAGVAALWGVQVRAVPAGEGRLVMSADDLVRQIRPASIHAPDRLAPEVQQFVQKFRARYSDETPNGAAALSYDAALMLAEAIRRAGSTEGAAIRDALAATKNFRGATGSTTIDANRNAAKPAAVVVVRNGRPEFFESISP